MSKTCGFCGLTAGHVVHFQGVEMHATPIECVTELRRENGRLRSDLKCDGAELESRKRQLKTLGQWWVERGRVIHRLERLLRFRRRKLAKFHRWHSPPIRIM